MRRPHRRTERCPLPTVDDRVLAADVDARRNVPHYDRAAMDGYAVHAADTLDASERSLIALDRTEEGPIEEGTASPVHTGSAIPDGADAVVRVERADAEGQDVLVLPGYPVSCLVGAVQFLRPAIAWTTGTEPVGLPSLQAPLTEPLPGTPGKRTFARVRLVEADDTPGDRTGISRGSRSFAPVAPASCRA